MKVQLIVVQGKPEGKIIPLSGPVFKIGRGENCHLRPNSEQVSREHSEFSITAERVIVRDLGSRNGTFVNNKALTEPCILNDRDLIQIGPLTFAISIQGAPAPAAKAPQPTPAKVASPDDVSHADIEAWLVSDNSNPTPERPSGVYGGDTQTISAYRGGPAPKEEPPAPPKPPAPSEPESHESEEVVFDHLNEEEDETSDEEEPQEELIDESNPFYAKKKVEPSPTKASNKDSSDAASDILKRMMERRRSSR